MGTLKEMPLKRDWEIAPTGQDGSRDFQSRYGGGMARLKEVQWQVRRKAPRGVAPYLKRIGRQRQMGQLALAARPTPRTTSAETSRPDRTSDTEAPASAPPVSGSIEPNVSPVHSLAQMPTQ